MRGIRMTARSAEGAAPVTTIRQCTGKFGADWIIEATNNKIKLIIRKAYGFRNIRPGPRAKAMLEEAGCHVREVVVLPRLIKAGLRVDIVKGDAHGYTFDTAGKDSSRFRQTGADAVAVASPDDYFIEQRTRERINLAALAARFIGVDLALVESRAHGPAPVIALCRDDEPFLREGTAAIFSKPHVDGSRDSAQYDLDDIDAAVKVIVFLTGK